MTLHVDFFSSPKLTISKPIDFKSTLCSFVQFRNHLFVIKSTKISSHRKAERLLFFLFNSTLVFKLLSCLKATSPFCRLKGKLKKVNWLWKGFLLELRDSLARAYIYRSCRRREFAEKHHPQSIIRVALDFGYRLLKNCVVSSIALLPLPDLFPPFFAGWSTFCIDTKSNIFTRITLNFPDISPLFAV